MQSTGQQSCAEDRSPLINLRGAGRPAPSRTISERPHRESRVNFSRPTGQLIPVRRTRAPLEAVRSPFVDREKQSAFSLLKLSLLRV